MDNLHRELAPISDPAWAQIEEEATRTLKRPSGGAPRRRPGGAGRIRSVSHWHRARHQPGAARGRGERAASGVRPLVELVAPFDLDRQAIDDVERGALDAGLAAGQGRCPSACLCRGPVRSSKAYAAGGIEGIRDGNSNPPHRAPRRRAGEYPEAFAQAISQLRLVGVNWPVPGGPQRRRLHARERDQRSRLSRD